MDISKMCRCQCACLLSSLLSRLQYIQFLPLSHYYKLTKLLHEICTQLLQELVLTFKNRSLSELECIFLVLGV